MRTLVHTAIGALLVAALGYGALTLYHTESTASPGPTASVSPVNAVLGNASYRTLFGEPPSSNTPERLRIQTHLAYVEALLRSRPRPSLSSAQRTRRAKLLDTLHEYWTAGQFPRNTEISGRTPVFIDGQGRLCAVGSLIATTAGRSLAERIDARYHLADVRNMNLPALDRWATHNGVTRRELAMIQPMYCGTASHPDPCYYRDEDEDASALEVTALSASVGASLLNGVLLERDTPSVVGGSAGVAGGATSLSIGLTDRAEYPTVSSLAGVTSIVLGSWNLISAVKSSRTKEKSSPTASQHSQRQNLQVSPTTITTVDGSTMPGVRATIEF